MKKLIAVLSLMVMTSVAMARENVTILYSWGPGDSMANINRTLAREATNLQDKYNFLFDTKPGAGGTLAALHVGKTPNHILSTSSAFFIRPVVYPNESYDISKYTTLITEYECPMAITSGKYKSWAEVPRDRPLNIGTSGLGVTTHLAANQIVARMPNVQVVPFKATSEALLAAAQGEIAFHVGFLSEPESWQTSDKGRVNVLGITGNRAVKQYQPLVRQGFDPVLSDMAVPFHLVIPVDTPEEKAREWREILVRAMKTPAVRELLKVDYCQPIEHITDVKGWYKNQTEIWRRLSQNIKVN